MLVCTQVISCHPACLHINPIVYIDRAEADHLISSFNFRLQIHFPIPTLKPSHPHTQMFMRSSLRTVSCIRVGLILQPALEKAIGLTARPVGTPAALKAAEYALGLELQACTERESSCLHNISMHSFLSNQWPLEHLRATALPV